MGFKIFGKEILGRVILGIVILGCEIFRVLKFDFANESEIRAKIKSIIHFLKYAPKCMHFGLIELVCIKLQYEDPCSPISHYSISIMKSPGV